MKNNININRRPLTQSDIEKGKNFNTLLKKINVVTKPFYKTNFFFSSVVVTSAVVLVVAIHYLYHQRPDKANTQIVQNTSLTTDSTNVQEAIEIVANDTTTNKSSIKLSPNNGLEALLKTTGAATTLPVIYKRLEKAPQLFIINSDEDTSITCAEGTIIKIQAHSFLDEKSGKEITGNIQVRIKEYYKLSDIILAKLSTMSDNNMLETGGMINIAAYHNKKACVLKTSKPIQISIPTNEKKEDMKLFNGRWKNNYLINWSLDTGHYNSMLIGSQSDTIANGYKASLRYSPDVKAPVFDKKIPALKYGFNRKIFYPKYDEKNIPSVMVSFVVFKDGHVGKAKIVEGSYRILDSAAVYCARHLPKCQSPGRKDGEPVDIQMVLPVKFSKGEGNIAAKDYFNVLINPGEPWHISLYDTTMLLKHGATALKYYMFNATSLGWLNCDRFESDPNARVNYFVGCNKEEDNNISIVFRNFKTILNGYKQDSRFSFWVPGNEDITVVAVKCVNGRPYLAVKETKTSATAENDLVYQPVSVTSLQTEMEKLDE